MPVNGHAKTLIFGAIQLVFVPKIKTDIYDETIHMSSMIISSPNIDFDGDALYMLGIKEMSEVPKFFSIHPRETILSKSAPVVSNMVNPNKQNICNLNRFLNYNNIVLRVEFL